jgi:hypothetical protein
MSWGMEQRAAISDAYFKIAIGLMQLMESKYGCVFVAAPGNDGKPASHFPALAYKYLKAMFVVGAVDVKGQLYTMNTGTAIINAYAAGVDVKTSGQSITGTSFAAPQVASLVAYFRSHPSWTQGKSPTSMLNGIQKLYRYIQYKNYPMSAVPIIWNGQTNDQCQPLKRGLESRQLGEGASCPLPDGDNGPDGPDRPQDPQGPRIEFKSGTPSPLCTANCGTLCSGFYCVPKPTGTPPDFSANPSDPLPPLTKTRGPTLTAGPEETCVSSTTVRECNGGPRGQACVTSTSCVSYAEPSFPALTSVRPYSPSGASCVSSTTWTDRGGPHFDAIITRSSCADWSLPATKTPTPKPTTTKKPEPTPEPARCVTAHFFIGTTIWGSDSWVLTLWDNGKELTCKGRGGAKESVGNKDVFEWDCGDGGYASITEMGQTFTEYTSLDGWTVKRSVRDWDRMDNIPDGAAKASWIETVYTGGDCSKCNKASLCDLQSWCEDFDGSCRK